MGPRLGIGISPCFFAFLRATSDSSIHVDIVMASAVLALDTILTSTKNKEGVIFWTRLFPDTN